MGTLARDLRNLGYSRTEKESPFDEDGELWTKGFELVCDETGIVIRKDGSDNFFPDESSKENVYRYQNSEKVKLPGGYIGSYDWGHDGDRFRY